MYATRFCFGGHVYAVRPPAEPETAEMRPPVPMVGTNAIFYRDHPRHTPCWWQNCATPTESDLGLCAVHIAELKGEVPAVS